MPVKYIELITYCKDIKGLKGWFLKNRPENTIELEDGSICIHKNILGAYYKGGESIAYMKVKPEEVAEGSKEGDEETKAGWLVDTPLEFWAKGENPWEQLTPEQVKKAKEIIGLPVDEEGNVIDSNPYKPMQYS